MQWTTSYSLFDMHILHERRYTDKLKPKTAEERDFPEARARLAARLL